MGVLIVFPATSVEVRRGGVTPPAPPFSANVQYALGLSNNGAQSNLANAPASGALFSAWVRIDGQAYPGADYTHGNIYPFRVYGTNWGIDCIAGNVGWNDSNGDAFYNANAGFGIDGPGGPNGFGDETWYLVEWLPLSYINGWVFVAWYFSVDGSGNFTKRQWVKYRGQPIEGPQSTDWTLSALRAQAEANGWSNANASAYTPSQLDHIAIAYEENAGSVACLRIEARDTVPSNAYVDSLATITTADPLAWAFYPGSVNLTSGAPELVDTSGNGRTPIPTISNAYLRGIVTQNSDPNIGYLLGLASS